MKSKSRHTLFVTLALLAGLAALMVAGRVLAQAPIGTNFTYQGQLKESGLLANGPYDFQFALYDAATGGSQVGSTLTRDDVGVTDGLFTVELDFGDVFDGEERWLEIAVRPGDNTGAYTTLSPRQLLTAAPYALHARRVWKLGGNSNVAAGDYLGTSDNQNLELRVNGQRALLIMPDATSPNIIGGYSGNSVMSGTFGATISGGGESANENTVYDQYGTIGGGAANVAGSADLDVTNAQYATVGGGGANAANDTWATVSGGHGNVAGETASTVSGGFLNSAVGEFATVGGGNDNSASGNRASVCGGENNFASGDYATVGGGYDNKAQAKYATIAGGGPSDETDVDNTNNRVYDDYGFIGGGGKNRAGNDDGDTTLDTYVVIGGGYNNTANIIYTTISGGYNNTATGSSATVGGGGNNKASSTNATVAGGNSNTASGTYSSVGGGLYNTASEYYASVVGGYSNTASNMDSTVGGGSYNTSSGEGATVGGGNYNTASGLYATVPGGRNNLAQGNYSFAAGRKARAYNQGCVVIADSTDAYEDCTNDNRFVFRVTNAFYIWTKSDHTAGVLLPTGGSAWSSLSDRNVKENFKAVDGEALLKKLAKMKITTWNYKAQDASIRHMGPMAQDFYAAFGLGEDDRHISTIDADGVALAAIQALYQQNLQLRAENDALKSQLDDLEARLDALEAALVAMQEDEGGAR